MQCWLRRQRFFSQLIIPLKYGIFHSFSVKKLEKMTKRRENEYKKYGKKHVWINFFLQNMEGNQ